MKRGFCILLLFALLFLPACRSNGKEALCLAQELALLYPKEGGCLKIYGREELQPILTDLYGANQMPVLSSVADYAAVLAQNDSGFEIHVLKMRHLSEMEEGEELLRSRKELLQSAQMRSYLGQRYDDYLSSALIYRKGLYLFLLITGENGWAIDRIEQIL